MVRWLMAAVLLGGCSSGGAAVDRPIQVPGFSRVELRGSDDVHVTLGSSVSVTAHGAQAELDRLDVRVEDGTLVVSRRSGGSWFALGRHRGVVVTVTAPALSGVGVKGSGNMTVAQATGGALEAAVAGSGDLTLTDVALDRLRADVGGSGDLRAKGRVRQLDAALRGSGNLEADGLVAQTAAVSVVGSGDLRARATGTASVAVTGSGNATVAGTRNCAITKTGSGEARCVG